MKINNLEVQDGNLKVESRLIGPFSLTLDLNVENDYITRTDSPEKLKV